MIRKIEEKDVKTVENLLKKEFHVSFPQENSFLHWLISEENSEIVGFICYQVLYEQLELNYIYVQSGLRGHHIASSLMDKMIEEAFRLHVEVMTLEVNQNNKIAIALYKKFGFAEVAIRKKYYGKDDGILMIRKLI